MFKGASARTFAFQVLFAGLVLACWEFIGRSSGRAFFVAGSPTAIFKELKQLVVFDHLLSHFWTTGSEAVAGIVMGTMIGASFGLSLWYSKAVEQTVRPFIIALGTLPILAFAPLMIVWFGIGWGMKVALAAFSTVFIAYDQAYRGAKLTSSESVDVLKGMNASQNQIFFKVVVPGAFSWVLSSMRLNVGIGLLGAFIGEFIASDRGLGYLILRASGLYNIPRAFAAAMGITEIGRAHV